MKSVLKAKVNKKQIRSSFLAVLASGILTWVACSTAWIDEAGQIVSALIPGVTNLVMLVNTVQGQQIPVAEVRSIESAATKAQGYLLELQELIPQYANATASEQPAVLNQIDDAINELQRALNDLLPMLRLNNTAAQTKISTVARVVLDEVQSLAMLVPALEINNKKQLAYTAFGSGLANRRLPLSANEFVSSFNAAVTAPSGNAKVDQASARLKIHVHGKLARLASLGIVK